MIALTDPRVFSVCCFYCGGGEFDHRRDTGACHAFERAVHKPYALYLRKVPDAAKGWVLR